MSADTDGLFPLPFDIDQFRAAFYTLVVAYVLFLLGTGWSYDWQEKLFPLLVGVPTVLIALIHIATILVPELEARFAPADEEVDITEEFDADVEAEEDGPGRSTAGLQRYALIILAWVIALPVLVYYLGYAYVLPPYVFAFVWYFRRDAKLAATISVGFTVAAYVLFILILGMIPWEGTLGLPNLLNLLF